MSPSDLNALAIAQFLSTHPDFFLQHRDLFSELRVPHPHETRAISLGERQILGLRAKNKDLERKLHTLIENASANQRITDQLRLWTCAMLAETDTAQLPLHIQESLTEVFDLDAISLHCWGDFAATEAPETLQRYAADMSTPRCGPVPTEILDMFPESIQSVAIVPLWHPTTQTLSGVLVMGATQAERFASDMGTEFLLHIGQLCAAALSRSTAA